ncbi:MAG TPA: hypothetical protein VGP46_13370, partial [Acidimicrobiales bacterium]|nr:hypothetical protein [Acidimicrobiales bacterium]
TTYPLVPLRSGSQSSSVDGLNLVWFSGTLPLTPVAPYERTSLAGRGLPMSISPAQVEAQLTAAGIPVDSLTKALLPVLSPTELRQVSLILTTPVPLNYYAFGSGLVGANPPTGAIVDLKNIVDGIAVAPATGGLRSLTTILSRHMSVTGVPAAVAELRRFESKPAQPVYELQYSQTPASVASMASITKAQLGQIEIVTKYVPIGLVFIGCLLAILGVAVTFRRRGPTLTGLPSVSGHPGEAGEARPRRHVA